MAFWLAMRGLPAVCLTPGKDLTIGRGRECDVSVYSSLLSREHAAIRWLDGRPVLFDLDSANGCFVGPDRVHRRILRDGDVIRLGEFFLQFRACEEAPELPPDEELPRLDGLPVPEDEMEPGGDTRLYSRTSALQQRVFAYDELGWLEEQIGEDLPWLPELRERSLEELVQEGVAAAELWRLLALGVLAPEDPEGDLRDKELAAVAAECSLTKRGKKLCARLAGQSSARWNEIASLRYEARRGQIFRPLRSIARAYRPGAGLAEVDPARFLYEVTAIYAPKLERELVEAEMRRLLCLGFFCPRDGVQAEAWFPRDWGAGDVIVSARGQALMEGFRLEE